MDLIDRKQAIEIAIEIACNLERDWEYEQIASAMDNAFEKIPSARAKGKWKKAYADHEAFGERPFYRYCSVCNEVTVFAYNYCPNCGAEMREVEE